MFAFAVIAAALFILLLFILRKSLIRVFPVLFVLAIFIPLIFYLYRRHKYRDLEAIYPEYRDLAVLLHERGMHTYLNLVQRSMDNIIDLRNKAEHIQDMLARDSVFEVHRKIEELDRQIETETDPEQKELLQRSLKEFEENAAGFERLNRFLEKYESSKNLMAGYFKNIRLKIQMNSLNEEALATEKCEEIDRIISDIDNIEKIYSHVDGGSPVEIPADEPAPPPPEKPREKA